MLVIRFWIFSNGGLIITLLPERDSESSWEKIKNIKITKKKNYVYLVELEGSIDNETHQQLDNELKEIINAKTKGIIFDMTDVKYLSSVAR